MGAARLMDDLPPPPPGYEIDAPPEGYVLDKPSRPVLSVRPTKAPEADTILVPSGRVHDGDTFGLRGGGNARLSGVDAFELNQTGRDRRGNPIPLGFLARDYLGGRASPDDAVTDTGARSYDRPVVVLREGKSDVGRGVIDEGLGLAAPDFLKGDPRLPEYMEAERLSRLNRRGAFAGEFQSPSDFRHGKTDPWATVELSPNGKGDAVFFDEPTPFQGLRPEIAKAYVALAQDPRSTAADLVNFAKEHGFTLSPDRAAKFIKDRSQPGAKVGDQIQYEDVPRALTDQGDGAIGAAGRGLADPLNMLDELGGVVDTLGGTPGRENIWSSDRRFGDVLWNNIDQNRDILAYDDAFHPYARFGGQLASGALIPGASVEGVGLAAGRAALREGATMAAARQAARAAVRNRLIATGAAEGGAAGFGAGEGNPIERLPETALGAGIGAAGGAAIDLAAPVVSRGVGKLRRAFSGDATPRDLPVPPEGYVLDEHIPADHAAMAMDPDVPSITAPARMVDRIDVDNLPPPPDGYTLDDPRLGRARPMGERASAEDMANVARTVAPEDFTPIPHNAIESLDEALKANPGPRPLVPAPDERQALPSYRLAPDAPVRRDPLDLLGWLRTKGGIRDQGGELSHMGVDNKARGIDFAKSEGFLGKLVNDEGMTLDDAAQAAWEAGYFPDHAERPTVSEFLDAVRETHRGGPGRVFHPDDYGAIDAYHGAQAQRLRVEKAADAGAPLAEDIGRPITLADLDANQPPATAYEDLPKVGGKAGNIDVGKLETRADIRRALINTEARVGGFDAARRGKITQAETEALARELGMTANDLLKRREGQALNAEQALAARSILAKSADELVTLAGKVKGGSDEDLAAFRRSWLRHVAIQEQVSGATAEAGRALAQFKMAGNSKLIRGRVLESLIEKSGGRDRLEDVAEHIIDLQKVTGDPGAVNTFAQQALRPRFKDKLIELYYNSMLSGPATHAVNILSNAMTSALQIPEHAAAAGIGAARKLASRSDADLDRVLASEVGARAVGLLQGTREGLQAFARTARTGVVPDHVTKVEAATQEAISGLKGKIIRTPTRLLAAEDELFKAIGRRMEINGLAVREARKERLKGKALRDRIASLSARPTDQMTERAMDYARYVTFQRPLGKPGQALSHLTQVAWPLKLVVPFIRTPVNILKYAVERSPGAVVSSRWRADFAAGGARRDLAVAKMALGTGLGMMVAQWAADGRITGATPTDRSKTALMRADGWQPYSIKLGGKYYAYNRLDPLAMTLGMATDMAAAARTSKDGELDDAAKQLTLSMMDQVESKTFLSGIADLMGVIDPRSPGGGLEKIQTYLGREAGGLLVPSIVAQTARAIDPVSREAKGFVDPIKARIPGLSNDLEAKRDVFGKPITSEGGIGPDISSPIRVSTARNDKVVREVLRTEATIGKLPKKVFGRDLSPKEYTSYQELAGRYLRADLEDAISSPDWQTLTSEERRDWVDKIKNRTRKAAREELFGGPQ